MSGSGKTFFTSLFTLRSVLRGVRTVIIDPEDEYYALTEQWAVQCSILAAGSNEVPNPFDVEEEEYFNKTTNKVEKKFDLKSKVLDVLNLIKVMYPNISDEQAADTEEVIRSTYEARGCVDEILELYMKKILILYQEILYVRQTKARNANIYRFLANVKSSVS